MFPPSIPGVILYFTFLQLTSITRDMGHKRSDVSIMLVTAGLALWHLGVAYLTGPILYHGVEKRALKSWKPMGTSSFS